MLCTNILSQFFDLKRIQRAQFTSEVNSHFWLTKIRVHDPNLWIFRCSIFIHIIIFNCKYKVLIEQSTKLLNFILILLILHNIFSTCSHALLKRTLLSTFLSPYHLKTNDNWDGCFLVGTLAPITFQVIAKSSLKLKVTSLFFKFQFGDYCKLMVCQFCIY